jgi:hypothetical protein
VNSVMKRPVQKIRGTSDQLRNSQLWKYSRNFANNIVCVCGGGGELTTDIRNFTK